MNVGCLLQIYYIVSIIIAKIKGDDIVAILYQICLLITCAVVELIELSKTREVK